MSRIGFVKLLAVLVLTLGSNELWATIVYQVGNCTPGSFPTITAALTATPHPNVVKICPGTYPEQIHITYAVTLQGMISGNSGDVIIASPPNGLLVNATDDLGDSICADIFVDVLPAPFNISDITLDAANNHVLAPNYVAGIFVKNSPGTVNHVATRNQMGGAGGVGIWLEGGTSNPTVTVENSSISAFDFIGIWTQTNAAAPELTALIKNNDENGGLSGGVIAGFDIEMGQGATTTVSGNILLGGMTGVMSNANSIGHVSKNTLVNNGTGVVVSSDQVSVTGNKIWSGTRGILVNSALPVVQSNMITGCQVGIGLNGFADGSVRSNTIMDGAVGLDGVPVGFTVSNFYYNVGTIMVNGG
jgi:hypothetical protein